MVNWHIREGRSGDAQVIEENWIGDNYRLGQLSGTVVDIGANIGAFALRAISLGAKQVRCYEPEPENYALLLEHCAEEIQTSTIVPHNVAVWDGMPVGYLAAGATTTTVNAPGLPRIPSVALERILMVQPVEYLKIDAEGAEEYFIPITSLAALAQAERIGVEYHRFPWAVEDKYPLMVDHLSKVFSLEIVPSSEYGGMVFGCQ